jgi:hypothetical protein
MQTRPNPSLRVIALFEELSDAELARIAASCSTKTYEKNAQILGDQDLTTDVFFILAGSVRTNSVSPKGREVIYSELSVGDIVGEFSAIDGKPRSSAVFALSDCVVSRMPAARRSSSCCAATAWCRPAGRAAGRQDPHAGARLEVSALSVRERRCGASSLRLATGGERQGRRVVIAVAHALRHRRPHRFAPRAVTREFNRLEAAKLLDVSRRRSPFSTSSD